ncbi:MAG: ABC transporter substrate-binding protein [Candidatus Dormibacteria bacterium]
MNPRLSDTMTSALAGVRRFARRPPVSLLTLAAMAVVSLGLSVWSVIPAHTETQSSTKTVSGMRPATTTDAGGAVAGTGGSTTTGGGTVTRTVGGGTTGGGGGCSAGQNGGSTDVGVTANSINLASTVVESGVGQSFLGDVHYSMLAVRDQVNNSGGICGRQLNLTINDDAWDPTTGGNDIRSYINAGQTFALAVEPSSEGLRTEISNGDIDKAGIPVVGTDGMLADQYQDPWVWPVATSTVSTMHIIAQYAVQHGAKTFGIAYDRQYHFGREGANAFDQAVKRLTGHDISGYPQGGAYMGLDPNQPSYTNEIQTFNTACNPCDFVALLLEPGPARLWMDGGAAHGTIGTAGAQPLFDSQFAQDCQGPCDGLVVFTAFKPPVGSFANDPDVSQYANDVTGSYPTAHVDNSFVESGYIGMKLLVDAMRRVGPDLTRQRLKLILDSESYDSHLTPLLQWSPGHHLADISMQGLQIVYKNGFDGWRDAQTGFIADQWPGQDFPPPDS